MFYQKSKAPTATLKLDQVYQQMWCVVVVVAVVAVLAVVVVG